jgi:hypothetical protein
MTVQSAIFRYRRYRRYRIYPNDEQIARLAKWEDALRCLWNLAHEQRLYGLRSSVKRFYHAFDQINELTALRAEFHWLADVPRNACAQLLIDLDEAWQFYLGTLHVVPLEATWTRCG